MGIELEYIPEEVVKNQVFMFENNECQWSELVK